MLFQIAGLIILAVFYGCYFIKMISQKKKGIQTNQMGKGKTGFVKGIEMTLKAVTFFVPIVEVVSIALNMALLPDVIRYMGICIGIAGVGVFITSVMTMRDSWRAGVAETDKTELVTAGIYQISRNPAFLGFDLVYIGILLMFFNWFLLVVTVFAIFMLHLQIVNVEEDFLLTAFGDEYLVYRKQVNRYLGRRMRKR
ncbi:MAG: isoprenylcysteine carboxylmethyltransferase family protein [Roseburia sp.]|nr:isoprenylcysteine carboxylmethyltransferase family protein [Roseburia sp.]MCM1241489.1 isoprenylcysteine carboxylmethyltransferase family protein [Roseburia sp.]